MKHVLFCLEIHWLFEKLKGRFFIFLMTKLCLFLMRDFQRGVVRTSF